MCCGIAQLSATLITLLHVIVVTSKAILRTSDLLELIITPPTLNTIKKKRFKEKHFISTAQFHTSLKDQYDLHLTLSTLQRIVTIYIYLRKTASKNPIKSVSDIDINKKGIELCKVTDEFESERFTCKLLTPSEMTGNQDAKVVNIYCAGTL